MLRYLKLLAPEGVNRIVRLDLGAVCRTEKKLEDGADGTVAAAAALNKAAFQSAVVNCEEVNDVISYAFEKPELLTHVKATTRLLYLSNVTSCTLFQSNLELNK